MPKTRRAGRKNQLRKIKKQYYESVTEEYSSFLGVEYIYDPEYEEFFAPKPAECDKNNNDIESIPWKLVPIDFENKHLPSLDIPEGDPRRTHYAEKRIEVMKSVLLKR